MAASPACVVSLQLCPLPLLQPDDESVLFESRRILQESKREPMLSLHFSDVNVLLLYRTAADGVLHSAHTLDHQMIMT